MEYGKSRPNWQKCIHWGLRFTIPRGRYSEVPVMAEKNRVMAAFAAVAQSFLAVTGILASGWKPVANWRFIASSWKDSISPGFFANVRLSILA